MPVLSSRLTSQKIKTHRVSYFQRKPSGILETDAASFQPILILLPDDTVAIILGLTQLDRAALLTGSPSPLSVKACRLRTALESKGGLSVSEMPAGSPVERCPWSQWMLASPFARTLISQGGADGAHYHDKLLTANLHCLSYLQFALLLKCSASNLPLSASKSSLVWGPSFPGTETTDSAARMSAAPSRLHHLLLPTLIPLW